MTKLNKMDSPRSVLEKSLFAAIKGIITNNISPNIINPNWIHLIFIDCFIIFQQNGFAFL